MEYYPDSNIYRYENRNFIGRFGGTNIIVMLNDTFELIEENQDIDIQSIEHNELDILQEILGKCDLWKGNEDYVLKVINENNNRLVDAILKVSKENETLTNAIKQLDRQINNN